MLMTTNFISPAQRSSLNSILLYPTQHFIWVLDAISNVMCSKSSLYKRTLLEEMDGHYFDCGNDFMGVHQWKTSPNCTFKTVQFVVHQLYS